MLTQLQLRRAFDLIRTIRARFVHVCLIGLMAAYTTGCVALSKDDGLERVYRLGSNRKLASYRRPRVTVCTDDDIRPEINYVRAGNPNSRNKLVFIHGYPSSLFTWTDVIALPGASAAEDLRNDYELFALDLPGHGFTRTDKPLPDYYLEPQWAARFVVGFLDALGQLDKNDPDYAKIDRAVLVGNSFGGLVACHVAALHPERVAGLVLLDPEGVRREEDEYLESERDIRSHPCITASYSSMRALQPIDSLLKLTFRSWAGEVEHGLEELMAENRCVCPDQRQEYVWILDTEGNWHSNWYLTLRESGQDEPVLAAVGRSIGKRALIIWGREDKPFPFSRHTCRFREWFPEAHFRPIDQAGHIPQEEVPAQIVRLIKTYWPPGSEERPPPETRNGLPDTD